MYACAKPSVTAVFETFLARNLPFDPDGAVCMKWNSPKRFMKACYGTKKHIDVKTRQFDVDELGKNQPGSHREAKARHGLRWDFSRVAATLLK